MDSKDTKEYTMDDLEDIIREYSSRRLPNLKEELPADETVGSDTVRLGPATAQTVRLGSAPEKTVRLGEKLGDTVRLGGKDNADLQATKPLPDLDEDVRIYQTKSTPVKKTTAAFAPRREEAAKEKTGAEPIVFPTRNRRQLLREKLEQGPQRRYQDMSRHGLNRLQAGMFLNLMLFLAASATALLYFRVNEERLQLMVIGQLLLLVMSASVGWQRLLEGVKALIARSFRLESLLTVTFVVCFLDGLLCLKNHRLPFASVFSLQMLMAQWAEYQQRQTEMSQLDTLRKASDLTAVVKTPGYYKNCPAYQTVEGHPEDFMDHYRQATGPEKVLCYYAQGVLVLGVVLAVICSFVHDFSIGIRVYAAVLVAAMPASVFVCIRRPAAILEKRMHKLGTVLCGWRGLQNIEKQGYYPLHHKDLFPENHVKLNGVRFYGERNPNTIVSYVSALMAADGGALAVPFEQLRSSRNARVCKVEDLTGYPDGVGGSIDGLSVIAGTMDFMEDMGVALPDGARIPHAVYAAVNQSLCAVFAVSFTRSKSSASGLRTLCDSSHVRPILVDCDFLLTGAFLEQKLGVNIRKMQFPDSMTRMKLSKKTAAADAPAIALATRSGLAQRAYAVTGGAALRSAWRAGAAVHILGGGIGCLAVAILAMQGALTLLTPYNLLLYCCVWMIPGLLMTEWTRSV